MVAGVLWQIGMVCQSLATDAGVGMMTATNLACLSVRDRAEKMAALCGGVDNLMKAAEQSEDLMVS